MASKNRNEVLERIKSLQKSQEISIIRLSEPITLFAGADAGTRISDASSASASGPSPASLDADLAHYSELFSKLRFSYVEQVTKEKFIRAIVGDPPLIVTASENGELEKENAKAKMALKSLKVEVSDMIQLLEHKGRELSSKYQHIQLETARLEDLPRKMTTLQTQVDNLRKANEISGSEDHELNLPLAKTEALVLERRIELQYLTRELEALKAKAPRKRKEADRLLAEMGPLENKQQMSAAAAKDAKRRKEVSLGGVADDLEQRARWWRANEAILQRLLDTGA